MRKLALLALPFAIAGAMSSCVTHTQLVNFDDEAQPLPYDSIQIIDNRAEIRVQAQDLLHITVHSQDPEVAAAFNIQQGGMGNQGGGGGLGNQGGGQNLELFFGYLVDDKGNIDFPVVGKVQVAGLTIDQAKARLTSEVQKYLRDAVINMRFLNFKITVLGEVNAPGTFKVTNERFTVLEAIGQAGDMTDYASRDNVLVIRERQGQREYARLNLQSADIFTSPYFYLTQNDIVYVEPTKPATARVADPVVRYISIGSGLASLVALVISLTN